MLECVPNVSEGRDEALISRMGFVVTASGIRLLDVHSDEDHHRSVLTLVGDGPSLLEACEALVSLCVSQIDLRTHVGVHPRMGAVDVIPFVPLHGSDLPLCVKLARELALRVADRHALPVYLYGAAATRADRADLAKVRRGGVDGVSRRLVRTGERPDAGPPRLHPTAGAIAVGARPFLVAYNVVLDTEDVAIARSIASSIREARGGPPGVKALGLSLPRRRVTQVSMNLTDARPGIVLDAYQRVAEAAERMGVEAVESEIVGLAPRCALEGATREDLRLTRPLAQVTLESVLAKLRSLP